jgi:hypothetical protein
VAVGAIPVLAWLAAALVIFVGASRATRTLRESLLAAAALAAGWLVLGTELLSLWGAVRFWPVLLWWAMPALSLVAVLARRRDRWREWSWQPTRPSAGQLSLLLALVFLLGWSFCQAAFSPPNNIDSLSYHLPRQVYWLQQGSVANYPTSSLRQIAMPPLTEFAGLHLMVLTGSDRLHNLVQWTALVLTLAAVSLTTRRLGGTRTAELLAMLWVATIPMAFLQASNTKNDVVVALWSCALLLWVLELERDASLPSARVLLCGLAFGALALTKGTGIIFGLPIGGLLLLLLWRHHRGRAMPALLLVAAVAAAVNAGAFHRNVQAFGTPIPDDPAIHGGDSVVNQAFSGNAILSNVVRNLAPHFTTPSQAWNDRLTALVLGVHGRLGIAADDPRTTWRESGFRAYSFNQDSEDTAAAPVHIWLLLLLATAATRPPPARGATGLLWLVLLAAFLLFCVALKWQVWHVRLVVAPLAWVAPLFACAFLERPLSRLAAPATLGLVVGLSPSLNLPQRPLLGPASVFTNDADAIRFYPATDRGRTMAKQAERMRELRPRIVGIATGWSYADYQVQRALLDGMSPPPRFTVFNATLQVPGKPEPDPDVLLVGDTGVDRLMHRETGTWYVRRERMRPYELLLPEAGPDGAGASAP